MASRRSIRNALALLWLLWLLQLTPLDAIKVPPVTEHNNNELDANQQEQPAGVADVPALSRPRQYPGYGGNCPLCDASVYSYCSHKIIHDSCCCDFPVMQLKPPQCYYYDCALLYAKSCYEHALIKNCCCNNPY